MTAAIANAHGLESLVTPSVLDDMVWNLQTWPLDLVEWPTHNSHRMVRVCVWSLSTWCLLCVV
jgi:hypothetical protein